MCAFSALLCLKSDCNYYDQLLCGWFLLLLRYWQICSWKQASDFVKIRRLLHSRALKANDQTEMQTMRMHRLLFILFVFECFSVFSCQRKWTLNRAFCLFHFCVHFCFPAQWGTADAKMKNPLVGAFAGLPKVPSFQAWPGLLPGPLQYNTIQYNTIQYNFIHPFGNYSVCLRCSFLPSWFILLQFL